MVLCAIVCDHFSLLGRNKLHQISGGTLVCACHVQPVGLVRVWNSTQRNSLFGSERVNGKKQKLYRVVIINILKKEI